MMISGGAHCKQRPNDLVCTRGLLPRAALPGLPTRVDAQAWCCCTGGRNMTITGGDLHRWIGQVPTSLARRESTGASW
eukprot:6958932-Pyramimonas_sp.AAC.1